VRRERGLTLIESTIASAIMLILASAGYVGGRAHLEEIGRSHDVLAASKAAASRLEAIAADPSRLEVGERPVDGVPHATEIVTRREPGLLEVTVRVTDGKRRVLANLTTLIAREERR